MPWINRPSQPLRAVLFDLDGTLLDTAPDMAQALNRLRLECNRPPLPFALIRPQVSNGARGLLELGFNLRPGETGFEILRDRFLQLYRQDLASETRLFDELHGVLDQLEQRGLPWGIVTNKPGFLTRQLLHELGMAPAVVVSGDDLPRRKPFPDQLLHAAQRLQLPAAAIAYVGDHERDIEASRAAEMPAIAARWGYLDGERPIEDWQAGAIADHPADLRSLIFLEPAA
ncbi:HAD-IA family hydrolase [Halothiobacillus sp. DCM-1]|uniref:HAD-IA family hydrolase n=1 Tax=Halothiobacillus sp. DCM-1 TaxID=3112558 RepID=UPI00324D89FB